jgi:N-acetylglucosamine-6-phosphate deacetylase
MGVHVAAAGMVLTPDGVVPGEVMVDDGVVVDVRRTGSDAPTRWVCPGFVDLQVNGSHGIDVAAAPTTCLLLADLSEAWLQPCAVDAAPRAADVTPLLPPRAPPVPRSV